ncbi:Diacylglycerol O-acyltransferase OS=Tsukamurella paurometabola (strain ATCC 8368 / DSM / CCUG 35730 / CIP 100753 / JCM 10117 / KCTC 9821 / NBRC 16120 /NCIMB 702349 / NCTC 13040) OX=521096 GN=Tpau_1931 PE=3 SV=1 [Tsukamurella paurometabola]|uniref:Diacylglycerol O-acyltransferase n=1 Tax=Tsukamurella paurometabola (strain ATCC 8368 / DSM 20162 / CCUG 35730 / CIP 100753 / JCM 10117 / KCTC 9821 / NBRC 16120 / NCIMB 702349 / NCTC 13040) TaxID=521096 RepID=D5UN47_TSUPD|nr:wax ester/triacylglycerol synthase family O-acyltransferase [Tsukamurella paurometabola]ADG78544.1 acyltransferase, WS/DGAT/MGAT [Tsukamurella paurometabola DSM 20162]SUP32113.1 Diacylglycerol O-acyltransferase [Tsukamurella paurometabola]
MSYMPVTDSMFLVAESREHPMHVGGLQLFTPPDGAGPDYVRSVVETMRAHTDVSSRFGRRPADPVGIVGNTWWTDVDSIDVDYHVRHTALPQPGRIRELFQMVSLWHETLLDRHRPMWELQVIEGLEDGRFAVYSKVHHSLVDGVSALKYMTLSLSEDPNDMEGRVVWQPGLGKRARPQEPAPAKPSGLFGVDPLGVAKQAAGLTSEVLGMVPASLKVVGNAFRDHDYMAPFQAPHTIFNVPIGGARRFVAQSYSLERINAIRRAAGATVNDVVLAMCGGALRSYLAELGELPDRSLTAMVPVNLRKEGDASDSNAVGTIIATLGTDIPDAADRLHMARDSVRAARRVMGELSPMQVLAVSAANIAGLAPGLLPGYSGRTRPPFNLVISNVPGPRAPMYWNGSRLDGIYPASIVLDGAAINITISTNYDNLEFGIVACRTSVPHVQRLIHHLEDALGELEKAFA